MLNGAPRDPNAVVEDPATATRSARVRLWSPLFADAVFHLVSPLSTRNTSHILAHQHHVQGNRGLGFLLADLYRERVTAICVTHSACHGIRLPRRARVTRKIFSSHGACPGFKALSIRFLSVNVVPLSTPSVTAGIKGMQWRGSSLTRTSSARAAYRKIALPCSPRTSPTNCPSTCSLIRR